MIIEDGKTGSVASVHENRLEVASLSRTHIFHHSWNDEDAFNLYGKHTIVATGSDEGLVYLKNDSTTHSLVINKILLSTNTTTNTKFEVHVNPTYNSGGTVVPALNFNRASGNISSSTQYDNRSDDLSVTPQANSAAEVADVRLSGNNQTFILSFDEALILGTSDDVYIMIEGTAGDKVRCAIHYFNMHTD